MRGKVSLTPGVKRVERRPALWPAARAGCGHPGMTCRALTMVGGSQGPRIGRSADKGRLVGRRSGQSSGAGLALSPCASAEAVLEGDAYRFGAGGDVELSVG